MKNFTIKSINQDSSGRHTIAALSEDNDTFNLNVADKGCLEVGQVVEIVYQQVAVAHAAEQGQAFAGSTDETPRQHSDSFSSPRDLAYL